jgi:pimeloyl-ACP methyl ester carboxylesterase
MLLLHGTDDSTIPIENAYRLEEANPQIKLVEFKGGEHSNWYELDPKLYRNELISYLNAVFD